MKKKILIVLGTRPEIIKFYPLIKELKKIKYTKKIKAEILYTNQHVDFGKDLSKIFKINFTHKLLKKKLLNNSFYLTNLILNYINKGKKYSGILVLGDTMTAITGAMAGYLSKTKVFYLESGLRTNDFNNPWPEEGFRKAITQIVDIHFAPTNWNKKILLQEGIKKERIFVTGNTVVDAIKTVKKYISKRNVEKKIENFLIKILGKKIFASKKVVITLHRRENFGVEFEKICSNIIILSKKYPSINFIFPVHPNPYIKSSAQKIFKNISNVFLIKPLNYFNFLTLCKNSEFIISDSGGIQEEAAEMKKFVLLARKKTERPEVENKLVFVCGSNLKKYLKYTSYFLSNKTPNIRNPFGDGKSSVKIINNIISNI